MHAVFQRVPRVAVIGALLALMALPSPAVASTTFGFAVDLWERCLEGKGVPQTWHTISNVSSNGRALDRLTARADGLGRWSGCFGSRRVQPGDHLRVRAGGSERTWRVPRLVIDPWREEDAIGIRARASTRVTMVIEHRAGFEATPETFAAAGTTGSDRRAFVPLSFDLLGNDLIRASYRRGPDAVRLAQLVPFLKMSPGSHEVTGAWLRGQRTDAWLVEHDGSCEGGSIRGRAPIAGSDLLFESAFYAADGSPVGITRSDFVLLMFEDCHDYQLPWTIRIRGDASSDVVSGYCHSGAPYKVNVTRQGELIDRFVGTTTNWEVSPSGAFSEDRSAHTDLKRGDQLMLTCRDTWNGDYVFLSGAVAID